jgi:putative two-component system response regulator
MDKPRVLLVDDNEATCTLVTALLQREFTVDAARDGREAIERLTTKRYGAVILDLLMPEMDGFAVLDYLLENDAIMLHRVLVLSAAVTPGRMERLRRYTVGGILFKPFELDTLLIAVKECAGSGRPSGLSGLSHGVLLFLADFLGRRLS